MKIYSISLLFVVQVWNIKFYQCLQLAQITLPIIEITHYQGDYTTSFYTYVYRYHLSGATICKTDNVNKNICIVFPFLCFTHQMYSLVCQGNYYRTMVFLCLINDWYLVSSYRFCFTFKVPYLHLLGPKWLNVLGSWIT